jgi:NADH:ubiquinone oxidoreductase subunit 5 (subunit L)/multisubunit Na+/H+ antiporter MnhA subunit
MLWTVGALAVLSTIGGFLQWAPIWHPLSDWLDPVAAPFAEPTSTQEWITSAVAIAVGLLGIGLAWVIYAARREQAPKALPLLEKKF